MGAFVVGIVIIAAGVLMVGLAVNNHIPEAWQVIKA